MNPPGAVAPKPRIQAEDALVETASPSTEPNRDRSLAHSIAWNAAGDWLTQILSWAAFLVVVRLVPPSDFGIAAMSVLLLPYMNLVAAFGIPRAVVTLRDLTAEQLAQLNSVSFMIAIAWFLFAVCIAKPFATLFHIPRVAPVLIVASSTLILVGMQGVPAAILARDLRFRLLTMLGVIGTVVAAIATLVLAILSFGYWALVLGNLLGGLCRSVLLLRAQPCRLAWPRLNTIREPLRFGARIMVSMIASNSYCNLDNFVAGRTLGNTALGLYGTAWEFANLPVEKIATLVTTVLPSYLSTVQNDPALLRRYLRRMTETIALATFPATVGLGLVARDLVPLAFGSRWQGMIAPLQVLSFYAGFRSVVALLPRFLVAVGDVSYAMWNDLLGLALLPCAFYAGSRYGISGIAWGWVLAFPIVALPLYRRTLRALEFNAREYLQSLWPALEATAVMVIAVLSVRSASIAPSHAVLRIALQVSVGAGSYIATLWLRHRDHLLMLLNMTRRLLTRNPSSAAVGTTTL